MSTNIKSVVTTIEAGPSIRGISGEITASLPRRADRNVVGDDQRVNKHGVKTKLWWSVHFTSMSDVWRVYAMFF